ncbi:MAG: DUF3747 domain-containing protein [Cyanobacteria bacterium P01_A01_bin.116]
MKSFRLTIAALATAAIAISASAAPSVRAQNALDAGAKESPTLTVQNKQATGIGAAEIDQSKFILSTNPTSNFGGNQRYGLMIIEQKSTTEPCFSTTGSSPTQVNPLLAQMADFSGKCGRSTDTNGYAIRAGGSQVRYDPVLENEDGVLVLYAKPSAFLRGAEKFIIGQTDGIAANGYTQIFLKPGWRLTRKTVDGAQKGLLYLTNDLTVAEITGQEVVIEPGGGDQSGGGVTLPGGGTPAPTASFPDVAGDTYANEINRALQLGFIKGFAEDGTFRPRASLTREEIVSMVFEGLGLEEASVTSSPFSDVEADRWSAAKIQKAQALGIVIGDGQGSFRPTDQVTRAELIAIMNKTAQYRSSVTQLTSNQTGQSFSDISGHWADDVISNLSGYCGIATPLNETGSSFYPEQAAQRNYAAAAMVRLLDCSQTAAQ